MAFSPDGQTLVAAGESQLEVWDLTQREMRPRTLGPLHMAVAFAPDGQFFATSSLSTIELRWLKNGPQRVFLRGHQSGVMSLAFSPDGKTLASVSHDRTARLWDVATRKLQTTLPSGEPLAAVAFSPDGKLLLIGGGTAGGNAVATLWDVAAGRQTAVLEGPTGRVVGVAFAPDGKTAAGITWDGFLYLWDL
jgi:WD40 repeat protein